MPTFDIRPVDYHHPDAQRLIDQVQQEYVIRYGGPDETPVEHLEFSPPLGRFFLLHDGDGEPVAMGGWRMADPAAIAVPAGPSATIAELKRMYVVPSHRGRGYARAVLAHLESTAATAGATWLVLETGTMQPEAIALYTATGYVPVPAFGHYADAPDSIHLGKPLGAATSGTVTPVITAPALVGPVGAAESIPSTTAPTTGLGPFLEFG